MPRLHCPQLLGLPRKCAPSNARSMKLHSGVQECMKANPAAFRFSRGRGIGLAMAGSSSSFDARSFGWLAQLPKSWDQRRELRERSINGQNILKGLR